MEFSVVRAKGGVDDISYKRYGNLGWSVYLGNDFLGWAFRPQHTWDGWTAVSAATEVIGNRMVGGFHNHRYATNYLLEVLPEFKDKHF